MNWCHLLFSPTYIWLVQIRQNWLNVVISDWLRSPTMGDWPHVRCNRAQAGTWGHWSASNLLHWLILRMTLYSRLSVVHYNIYYTCTEYLTQVIFSQCKQPHCRTLICRLNIERHFWSRSIWLIDKTKGSNNDDPNWVFVAFHTDDPPILFLCFILKHFCRAFFSAQNVNTISLRTISTTSIERSKKRIRC